MTKPPTFDRSAVNRGDCVARAGGSTGGAGDGVIGAASPPGEGTQHEPARHRGDVEQHDVAPAATERKRLRG